MSQEEFIRVKPSYIQVDRALRFVYSCLIQLITFLCFLALFITVFQTSSPDFYAIAVSVSILVGLPLSLPLFFSERILRRLCRNWGYLRFYTIERLSRKLVLLSGFIFGITALTGLLVVLPFWVIFLWTGICTTLCFGMVLGDMFSIKGKAILTLKAFLLEFAKKGDETNFGKISLVAKQVSIIAKSYNMQISPYSLAHGMTISFLENRETTKKDFDILSKWIENPTGKGNFGEFRKSIKKYQKTAETSAKNGIREKTHLTYERVLEICKIIIIPIIVAVVISILPEVLK